ncbi:DUF6314 family protein [Plantibacter sp. YIM 135347]|uniref:DUF6314 family protein n=1 Tax=Plantibacter sp. YIM 135347 TaxID=3423919 RepID=UPI003D343557
MSPGAPHRSGFDLADPRSLQGRWSFTRVLTDHRSGSVSWAEGTLSIRETSPTRLAWAERGVWWRAGSASPVRRTLMLIHTEDRWEVTFDDERPFHEWIVDAELEHACSPDVYIGRVIRRGDDDGWRTVWNVAGPRKRHSIITDYAPALPLYEPMPSRTRRGTASG